MAIFKRGFNQVKEEQQRQEEMRNNKGLWRFFLSKDGDEAEITFLTEEPINYYEHSVQKYKNGKEFYENIPCTGDKSCPHCKNGNNPSFKSAWLIIDHREYEYKDSNGKTKKGSDQLRLFIFGTKVASNLDRISNKYGLLNHRLTIVRMGKGTSTTYAIERGDIIDIDPDDLIEIMPDNIKEQYDGSEESLYTIVENQIMSLIPNASDDDEDEEDDDTNALVNLDDEDEEEDEPVKKKSKISSGAFSKKSKPETKTSKFGSKKETCVKKKTSIKSIKKK